MRKIAVLACVLLAGCGNLKAFDHEASHKRAVACIALGGKMGATKGRSFKGGAHGVWIITCYLPSGNRERWIER